MLKIIFRYKEQISFRNNSIFVISSLANEQIVRSNGIYEVDEEVLKIKLKNFNS